MNVNALSEFLMMHSVFTTSHLHYGHLLISACVIQRLKLDNIKYFTHEQDVNSKSYKPISLYFINILYKD